MAAPEREDNSLQGQLNRAIEKLADNMMLKALEQVEREGLNADSMRRAAFPAPLPEEATTGISQLAAAKTANADRAPEMVPAAKVDNAALKKIGEDCKSVCSGAQEASTVVKQHGGTKAVSTERVHD